MNKFQQKLLNLLNEVDARYLVIGGYAMKAYGISRNTHDIDLLLSPTIEDAYKTLGALATLDAQFLIHLKVDDLLRPLVRIPIKSAHSVEVDLLTSIEHITFEEVFKNRSRRKIAAIDCNVASVPDLIQMKELSEKKCRDDASNINLSETNRKIAIELADRDLVDINLLKSL